MHIEWTLSHGGLVTLSACKPPGNIMMRIGPKVAAGYFRNSLRLNGKCFRVSSFPTLFIQYFGPGQGPLQCRYQKKPQCPQGPQVGVPYSVATRGTPQCTLGPQVGVPYSVATRGTRPPGAPGAPGAPGRGPLQCHYQRNPPVSPGAPGRGHLVGTQRDAALRYTNISLQRLKQFIFYVLHFEAACLFHFNSLN